MEGWSQTSGTIRSQAVHYSEESRTAFPFKVTASILGYGTLGERRWPLRGCHGRHMALPSAA